LELAEVALVGSGTGNGPRHGESQSTLHVEVELSFPFQTRDRSSLWLQHILGVVQEFQMPLTAQKVDERSVPKYFCWRGKFATSP